MLFVVCFSFALALGQGTAMSELKITIQKAQASVGGGVSIAKDYV